MEERMKRINILMACAALTMAFTGCDDDDDPIVLVDSGMTTTDAGMTDPDPDAGTTDPDPDAGPEEPAACEIMITGTTYPAAPASCLPRCAASTASCANSCGMDAACQEACFDADPTPGIPLIANGVEQPDIFDCSLCIGLQSTHCVTVSCGAEFAAWQACEADPAMTDCETQQMAISMCQQTNLEAIQSCFQPLANGCFGA